MWDSYFNLSLVISTSFGYPQQFFAMLCAETLSEQIHHKILYQSSPEHGRIQGGGTGPFPPTSPRHLVKILEEMWPSIGCCLASSNTWPLPI